MSAEFFTYNFRLSLIKKLIYDMPFREKFIDFINPNWFELHLQPVLLSIVSFKNEKITITDIEADVVNYIERLGIPIDIVNKTIKEIKNAEDLNRDILIEKIKDWIIKERVKDALKKSIEKLKDNDLEQIKKEIENAFDVNFEEDDGIVFEKDFKSAIISLGNRYKDDNLISTGFPTYDKALLGGYAKGELHCIQAPPKRGKSTIASVIGFNVLKQNYAVIHITLEISELDVMAKYVCNMTDVKFSDVVKLEYKQIILNKVMQFNEKYNPQLFIKHFPNKTINVNHIRAYINRLISDGKLTKDIGLIIVDYDDLLLPVSNVKDSYESAGDIYFDLVKLAEDYNTPVLTLAQPNRSAWNKQVGDFIKGEDISHSAKKIHNTFSISSLNLRTLRDTEDGGREGIYDFYIDLVRRGYSGLTAKLHARLDKASFIENKD